MLRTVAGVHETQRKQPPPSTLVHVSLSLVFYVAIVFRGLTGHSVCDMQTLQINRARNGQTCTQKHRQKQIRMQTETEREREREREREITCLNVIILLCLKVITLMPGHLIWRTRTELWRRMNATCNLHCKIPLETDEHHM